MRDINLFLRQGLFGTNWLGLGQLFLGLLILWLGLWFTPPSLGLVTLERKCNDSMMELELYIIYIRNPLAYYFLYLTMYTIVYEKWIFVEPWSLNHKNSFPKFFEIVERIYFD